MLYIWKDVKRIETSSFYTQFNSLYILLKFKFITIMVVSDLVCHGMVVPGKAVYINDSAKIAPD